MNCKAFDASFVCSGIIMVFLVAYFSDCIMMVSCLYQVARLDIILVTTLYVFEMYDKRNFLLFFEYITSKMHFIICNRCNETRYPYQFRNSVISSLLPLANGVAKAMFSVVSVYRGIHPMSLGTTPDPAHTGPPASAHY